MQKIQSYLENAAASGLELIKFVSDEDSPKLWVIFSHVDVPTGKFAQERVFKHVRGSKLFLNCLDNAWYSAGVKGFSTDLETTINKVLELARGHEVTFVGHSMGAYMSLISGNMLEGSRFLATSPELHLRLPMSRAKRNGVDVEGAWGDIEQLRHQFHGSPNGVVLMGAYDPIDCYFLSKPEQLQGIGRVFEVPHHHGVTEFMTSNSIYLDLFEDLANAPDEFVQRGFLAPLNTYGQSHQYELFYRAYVAFSEAEQNKETLRDFLDQEADWPNPGWQELRAKMWGRLGRVDKALEAAERAYQFQPDLMQFIDTYASCCAEAGDAKRLTRLVDSLGPSQLRHPQGARLVKRMHSTWGMLPQAKRYVSSGVEESAPLFLSVASNLTSKPNAEEVRQAIRERRYEDLLEMTEGLGDGVGWKGTSSILAMRAEALFAKGERAAGVRILRYCLSLNYISKPVPKRLLQTAIKFRLDYLVQEYLTLALSQKDRALLAPFLAKTLDFCTEPEICSDILAEVISAHAAPQALIRDGLVLLSMNGSLPLIARALLAKLAPKDLTVEQLTTVVELSASAGLRATTRRWLQGGAEASASMTEAVREGLRFLDLLAKRGSGPAEIAAVASISESKSDVA